MMDNQGFEVNLDNQFILSKHKILVDNNLKSLQTPEGVKNYAQRSIKRVLHDDAEISSVKLKRPNIIKKGAAKLTGKTPQAKLYITTKF